MKVLVTGGLGLIGSHVAEYYADKGDTVVIMDNMERSSLLGHEVTNVRERYNWNRLIEKVHSIEEVDISNISNWKTWIERPHGSFDVVIHCAAQCGVPTSIAAPRRDFEVNMLGTLNACEYAEKWNAKMVYASTNKVYPLHSGWILEGMGAPRWRWANADWHEYGFPVSAMPLYGARTPYGNSKYLGDLTCQEWTATYGTRIGIFRMSCIYGEHQMGFEEQGWATWFAIALENNLPVSIFGDGYQVRDMLHVSDVVRAYDMFIESDLNHGVWNLGGGPENTLSLIECVDMLEQYHGKKFSNVTYNDWRPLDQRVYTSDIRPLQEDLNWSPTVSPYEGMKKVANWVRENSHIF